MKPISFEVAGESYELARLQDLTFNEGLELKTLTGGMAPVEVQERLGLGDPEAWLGMVVTSMRRKRPGAGPGDLGNENLQDLVAQIETATLEALTAEADELPPTQP